MVHCAISRRIAALNTNGALCLRRGDLKEAILVFRHAIECMKSLVERVLPTCHATWEPTHELTLSRLAIPCLEESQSLQISPHNIFDIFQNAFILPKVESLAEFRTESSVVLFYNLALAHHLAGLRDGTEDAKHHLREGERFYQISLALLQSSADGLLFDASCYALLLALVTNLGHIFSHSWKVDEADSCRRMLEELLESGATLGLSDEEELFFLTSVAHSKPTHSFALAPAA